jgi:type II secretory pathway pseudopilin PulG
MKAVLYVAGGILLAAVVLGVGAVLLLLLFQPAQRASNERNASFALKTITVAQADFRANDRDGNSKQDYWRGDVAGLYAIKAKGSTDAIKLIEISVALADDRPVSDMSAYGQRGPKSGYWFRAIPHEGEAQPGPDRFAAMAHPHEYRKGLRLTFVVGEGNIVHKNDLGRTGGVQVYPADPLKSGWSKLD